MSVYEVFRRNEAIRHPQSVYLMVAFSTLPSIVNNQKPTPESVYLALPCELVLEISYAN